MNYMQRWVKERLKESFEKNILVVFDSANDKRKRGAKEMVGRKLVDNTIYHMLIDDKGTSILVGNESTIDKLLDLAGKNVWIPIEFRSMTKDEIKYYKDHNIDSTMIYDCCLPDDGEEVLITTPWGVEKTTFFNDDEYGGYFECYEDDGDVLAWMPLPERWEGNKNET